MKSIEKSVLFRYRDLLLLSRKKDSYEGLKDKHRGDIDNNLNFIVLSS